MQTTLDQHARACVRTSDAETDVHESCVLWCRPSRAARRARAFCISGCKSEMLQANVPPRFSLGLARKSGKAIGSRCLHLAYETSRFSSQLSRKPSAERLAHALAQREKDAPFLRHPPDLQLSAHWRREQAAFSHWRDRARRGRFSLCTSTERSFWKGSLFSGWICHRQTPARRTPAVSPRREPRREEGRRRRGRRRAKQIISRTDGLSCHLHRYTAARLFSPLHSI